MLLEMARMSCEDGLVMTLHPGVRRSHHAPTSTRFGPDTGHDIPIRVEFTDALRPLLERFGTQPGFHLVVFTLDETVWSRELAPLAGFYPSVYVGAPWWFLDAPEAIRRFRAAVDRDRGLLAHRRASSTTRARSARSRRATTCRAGSTPGVLAQLVAEHRLERGRGRRDGGRPRHRPADRGVQAVSSRQLSRTRRGRAALRRRVRLVHLGLGNFFRAHQAWYTDRAPDAADWGIAAFTGRSRGLADSLSAQDGLYTLVTRAADGDRFDVVEQPLQRARRRRPRGLAALPRLARRRRP